MKTAAAMTLVQSPALSPSADCTIARVFMISPLDLYAYLKARFGNPNGFQMRLKSPSSDNFTHWHWTLQHGDRVIEFMGLNLHAAAYIEGVPEPTSADEEQFTTSLKADFSNYGPQRRASAKVRVGPRHTKTLAV